MNRLGVAIIPCRTKAGGLVSPARYLEATPKVKECWLPFVSFSIGLKRRKDGTSLTLCSQSMKRS